ncbi:unnamed protein product [Closterium sp. NIES-65]|nr:unnamed protein product [Closterium sp. NIES-65]
MQQLLQLQQADPSPSHFHTLKSSHPSGAAGVAGTTDAGGVAGVKGALGEAGALGAASAAVTAMAQQLSASTLHGTQRPHQSALRADRRQLFDSLWLEDSDSLASPACAAEAPAISSAGKRSWGRSVKDTWRKQQEQLQVQQQQQQQHVLKQLEVQQEKKASKAAAALAAKDGLAQLEAFMEASMGRTAHSNIAREEEDLRSLEAVVMGLQSACLQGMDSAAAAAAPAAPTTLNEPGVIFD